MNATRFKIVYEKLEQATSEVAELDSFFGIESETTQAEIDEIAELRRLALEISEPEPSSYTIT